MTDSKKDFINMEVTEQDIPLFLDIEREVSKTPFGEIQFSVLTHQGKITTLTASSFRSKKFPLEKNSEAVAEVVSMLKNMIDRKQSGEITFTVVYREGNIREVVSQFLNKKHYQNLT